MQASCQRIPTRAVTTPQVCRTRIQTFLRAATKVAAFLVVAVSLVASARADETPAAPDWSVGLYTEADGEGGVGLAGNVSWYASERTEWFLAANYPDASDTLSGLSTRGLELVGRHDFGPVGFELSYVGWQDPDVVSADALNAAFDVYAGAWTVSVLGQTRQSDFETFTARALVTLRNGQQIPVVATANCSLDNTGLGLGLTFNGAEWGGYLRGMDYQYSATSCGFDSPALERLEQTRPAIFRQFAPRVTSQLSRSAVSRIGAENSLLDNYWGTGVRFGAADSRYSWAVDCLYQREYFAGLVGNTLSGTASREMNPGLTAYLTLGVTDSDGLDTVWFGGLGPGPDRGLSTVCCRLRYSRREATVVCLC